MSLIETKNNLRIGALLVLAALGPAPSTSAALAPFACDEMVARAASVGAVQEGAAERPLGGATKVAVVNKSGRVAVKGVGGDKIRMRAVGEESQSVFRVDTEPGSGGTLTIRADGSGDVDVEIEIPRTVAYLSVEAGSGDGSVEAIDGEVRLRCGSGDARVVNCGKTTILAGSGSAWMESIGGNGFVEAGSGDVFAKSVDGNLLVRSGSGDLDASAIKGDLETTLSSGELRLGDVGGSVHASLISGSATIDKVGGSVEISSASGDLTLTGVTGDVDAKTASGTVTFRGALAPSGRYHLKSMSGDVAMHICNEPSGFTVSLASYTGEIETSYPLSIDRQLGPITKRFKGRFGDGATQIELEAFSGNVQLLNCDGRQSKRR
jgi:DUF4097 and DUF4098 domain-containing protein YvlB